MERCGKINCVNAEAESWTGMGVVVGFADVMGMLALSQRKKAALISLIVYLHILQRIRGIDKTRNHLILIVPNWRISSKILTLPAMVQTKIRRR